MYWLTVFASVCCIGGVFSERYANLYVDTALDIILPRSIGGANVASVTLHEFSVEGKAGVLRGQAFAFKRSNECTESHWKDGNIYMACNVTMGNLMVIYECGNETQSLRVRLNTTIPVHFTEKPGFKPAVDAQLPEVYDFLVSHEVANPGLCWNDIIATTARNATFAVFTRDLWPVVVYAFQSIYLPYPGM
ncbi:uncharacterized protein LOC135401468 [Ornithodoros turicata]|uniref:uncharacterized protein LOC135401468 n=1 Tax=Ornithodoros turicata TaxID=34597 RepID=UPI003139879A